MNYFRCKICGAEYEQMPRMCEMPGCNNNNPAMWDVIAPVLPKPELTPEEIQMQQEAERIRWEEEKYQQEVEQRKLEAERKGKRLKEKDWKLKGKERWNTREPKRNSNGQKPSGSVL